MSESWKDTAESRRLIVRLGLIALLVCIYGALGVSFRVALHTNTVYPHFAYIPIVLASVWWGKKGTLVALILGALILLYSFFETGLGGLSADLARTAFFVVIALCVGTLSERVVSGQKSLRESAERHIELIEKSLAGVFVYRDDEILFANSRLGTMLGRSREELIGSTIWDLFYELDRPRIRELVAHRGEKGYTDLHYECRLVRQDGTTMWADVASSVIDFDGGSAVLVNVYDISSRKEAETRRRELAVLAQKQEEQLVHSTRLAELGEMAASVAHELNQPLTGIRNFARNAFYMLEKGVGSTEEVKDNLRLISDQVDRASKIINQMRELTKHSEKEFGPVDVNATLRESVEFLMPQMRLSGVDVELLLSDDVPWIRGDRIRLTQVFLNILTNARQAMEDTVQRRLSVRSYCEAERELPVVIEFTDTGKGFDTDQADRLFVPFFSTKEVGKGTGLGLSISLGIIQDHQGTIQAAGVPENGATFTIKLPAAAENGSELEEQGER